MLSEDVTISFYSAFRWKPHLVQKLKLNVTISNEETKLLSYGRIILENPRTVFFFKVTSLENKTKFNHPDIHKAKKYLRWKKLTYAGTNIKEAVIA